MGTADGADARVPTTIVVPLDGSDFSMRAVPVARRFGARLAAEVVAVTTPQTLDDDLRCEPPGWSAALGVRLVVSAADDPVDAVQSVVSDSVPAAVCMATHARGAVGSVTLGNTAQRVVREVGVPVLLVGSSCEVDHDAVGPLVVAHDGSSAADAVLAPARAWAHVCGVPIVLVYGYHPLDVIGADAPAVRAAREVLGPDTRYEAVPTSFAAGVVCDVARAIDAVAIAVSTHGQTGAPHVSMGRVASWITRESRCPVLTTRPPALPAVA